MLTDGRKKSLLHSDAFGPIVALVVLVAAAYITIFLDASQGTNIVRYTPVQIIIMVCAGVLYSALTIYDDWFYGLFPVTLGRVLYFGVQFGLVVIIGVASEAQGQWWLMILPVMGGGAVFDLRWMIGIGVAAVAAVCLGYFITLRTWEPLWAVPLYITPAVVFVLIFSRITHRERVQRREVERLAVELREANHKLSEYASKIEELAIMRERNRMAREIHDSLGHYLTVANVQIRAAQAIMDQNPAKAQDALQKASKLTQEGLQEVRQSVATLRESPTDSRPLVEIVRELVDESATAGIDTTLEIRGEARPLGLKTNRTVYRTVQESLTNIRKHAAAATAVVVLDFENPAQISVIVKDDGQGTESAEGGFGLLGMRERVNLLGGLVEIITSPGNGFQLIVTIPSESNDESVTTE